MSKYLQRFWCVPICIIYVYVVLKNLQFIYLCILSHSDLKNEFIICDTNESTILHTYVCISNTFEIVLNARIYVCTVLRSILQMYIETHVH